MRKYFLGIVAVVLAIGFSAFNYPVKSNGTKLVNTIYQYNGAQNEAARKVAANYSKVTSITCSGSDNECAVTLNSDFGTNPDFTNVTFASSTGFPNGGSAWVANSQKN